jgi:membrane protease YdiL (CAAX protease family)
VVAPWLFAAGVAALIALVSYTTVRSGLALRTWAPRRNLLLSAPDNAIRLALIALCLLLGFTVGPGPATLGWVVPAGRPGQDLALGIVAGLTLALSLNLGGRLAVRWWGREVYSTRLLRCMLPVNKREWVGVLLALLPAAALEELLFRSLPLGGLTWLVPPWWLLWPLALLFGLLHWPQGGWGVAGTAIAAVVLSLLFLASGSIWVPLTAHYAMNVYQLLGAKLSGLEPLRSGPSAANLPAG